MARNYSEMTAEEKRKNDDECIVELARLYSYLQMADNPISRMIIRDSIHNYETSINEARGICPECCAKNGHVRGCSRKVDHGN